MPSQVSDDSAPNGPNAGSVGIIIVASESINAFSYTITGPAGFSQSGTFNVAASSELSAVVGGLPPGTGFSISVTGASSDGATCSGSAPFSVTAGTTTTVTLGVDCKLPPKTGSVTFNGSFNVCPILTTLSASPSKLYTGSTSALLVAGSDADNGPSPLTYQWTTSLGTLSSSTVTNPTFTCTTSGTATVTVTASDGDPQAGCAATASMKIYCY
jgi:hypothetical protein